MDKFETWFAELSKVSQTLVIERMLQISIIRYLDWYLENRTKSVTDDYRVQLELVIMTCLRDLVALSALRRLGTEEARHTCLEKSYFSRLGRGKRIKLDESYTIFLGWSQAVAEKTGNLPTLLAKLREVHANSNLLEVIQSYVGYSDGRVLGELDHLPLNGDLSVTWSRLKESSLRAPEFGFFIKFFESEMGEGRLDPNLLHSVASVVDGDWEAGPMQMAERIAAIEADYLSEKTKLQETIELTPETGLCRVVTAEVQNPALTAALLSRVADCLDDALSGNNGLTPMSREVKTLRRTIEKYGNDPQRMELDFTSVSVSLRRQIHDTGELATSEDNLALLEATEEGARGIRANHPEIAENRNRLAQQALTEMNREDLEFLEEARPVLVALSEGQMAEDFARDIPQLINDALTPLPSGAPPLPGADEATRIFYRASRMATLYDAYQRTVVRGASIFDSPDIKTIRLVGVCGGVGAVLYQIVVVGLRAFGVL